MIAFTGYKWQDADDPTSGAISAEEGADNCVAGLKADRRLCRGARRQRLRRASQLAGHSHRLRGLPGYSGDDLDDVICILCRVGSPRVKLLFDIYHVQIMNGDVIRRLEETKDNLGHDHTAGNPGRCELDDKQEIQYAPVMQKLVAIGYQGYVGHEFIS